MKQLVISAILLFVLSCKKESKKENEEGSIKQKDEVKIVLTPKKVNDLSITKDTLIFSNDSHEIYSEYFTRGSGVVFLTFDEKLEIFNLDGSHYGDITNRGDLGYELKLPKKIIARYLVPDFDQFCFDSEDPSKNKEYIKIYINREEKIVKKQNLDFGYKSWNEYIKDSFFQFNADKKIYKVLKIVDDNTVLATTITENDCEGVENYSDSKLNKTIKWRNNEDSMNILFYECN